MQRQISAYNTKYGYTPSNDKSVHAVQQQVLQALDIKIPQDLTIQTTSSPNPTNQATIHNLQHLLPLYPTNDTMTLDEEIEFITDIDMEQSTPVINIMSPTSSMTPKTTTQLPPNHCTIPFTMDIITTNTAKNVPY